MAPPDQPPLSGDLQLLIEHAKELAEARHPDANAAWDRAAAAGTDLPPDAAAHLARSRAGRLLPGDPAEAYAALCEAAGQFAALGDRERELEARAYAAQAARLSGKSDEAEADVSLGWELLEITLAEAADAFGRGEMTTRYYLNVIMISHFMRTADLGDAPGRSPEDVAGLASALGPALTLAEQDHDLFHAGQCHDLLATAAAWSGDPDAAIRHLTAARESFLAGGMPWFAAQPAAKLAQQALAAGRPALAEQLAWEALTDGPYLSPQQQAATASVIAQALGQLSGAQAVEAYHRAADLFGALGNTVSQVRCQRSAAWIQFEQGGNDRRTAVATMRSVLDLLESLTDGDSPAAELVTERKNTASQLSRMLGKLS